MKRISVNATSNLDAASEPIAELTELPVIPPGGTPLRCGNNIYLDSEDWQTHCAKREHSYRGCSCAPTKPPKGPAVAKALPVEEQQRLSFGGPA